MSDPEALEELRQIAASLRAHVEWQAATGAYGLPAAPRVGASRGDLEGAPQPRAVAPHAGAPSSERTASVSRASAAPQFSGGVATASASPAAGAPSVASSLPAPSAPALDFAEQKRRLDVLAEKVKSCTLCGLHAGRTQTVFARGTGSSRLCFVGEGPGADEDEQGYPFVGKAGQLLDKMIVAMGFSRDEVYVCNIVKCRPPNNRKPEPAEMAACMPYLAEQLDLLNPEVIVALGATAVQGLLGTGEGIMRLRGKWKLYKGRIPVMPTFHPAYLLRTPSAKREVWDDLQAVLRQMGRSVPERR